MRLLAKLKEDLENELKSINLSQTHQQALFEKQQGELHEEIQLEKDNHKHITLQLGFASDTKAQTIQDKNNKERTLVDNEEMIVRERKLLSDLQSSCEEKSRFYTENSDRR